MCSRYPIRRTVSDFAPAGTRSTNVPLSDVCVPTAPPVSNTVTAGSGVFDSASMTRPVILVASCPDAVTALMAARTVAITTALVILVRVLTAPPISVAVLAQAARIGTPERRVYRGWCRLRELFS